MSARALQLGGLLVATAAVLALVIQLAAQEGQTRVRDFRIVDFYRSEKPGEADPVRYLVVGEEARPLTNKLAWVKSMFAQNNYPDGRTNLIARAPECIVDHARRELSGPGHIWVQSGDGQFTIEGDGFFCRLTNFSIVISNRVRTVIGRELLERSHP